MCELSVDDKVTFETEFEYIKINPNNFQTCDRLVAVRFINESLNADALVADEEDVSDFDDYDFARESLEEYFQNEEFPFSDYLDDCKGMFLLPNKWEWYIKDSINRPERNPRELNETLKCYIPNHIIDTRGLKFAEKSKKTIEENASGNRQTSMYILYNKMEEKLITTYNEIEDYISELKRTTRWKALETFRYYFIFDLDCGDFCRYNISPQATDPSKSIFFKHIGLLKKCGTDIPTYNDLAKEIEIKEVGVKK